MAANLPVSRPTQDRQIIFKTYANNTVVFYNNPASKKFPDEGVCDLSGHVLIAPAGLEFTRYMENGVLFAEGDAPYQIVVIQKDGKVLSRLEQDQAEKLGYVLPNLLSENDCFSDGRCPIEKIRRPAHRQCQYRFARYRLQNTGRTGHRRAAGPISI